MLTTIENQTIALAALFQAANNVHAIATSGKCDEQDVRTSLQALFALNAESVDAIYGGEPALQSGMQRLVTQLGGEHNAPDVQVTRYALTLLKIESKLQRPNETMNRVRRGIEEADKLCRHYDLLDEKVIGALATIYSENISVIQPRVMVHGDQVLLQQQRHADRIRAILLSGLRSAVLWRQCGGSRWKLVTKRQAYVNRARQVLRDND